MYYYMLLSCSYSWKCILVVTWAAFISITQVSCFFFRKPCTACSSKKWTRLFTSPSSWVSTIALTITPFSPIRPTSIYRNFGPRNKLASEAIIIVSSVSSHWLTSLMFKYCNFFKTNHRGSLLKKCITLSRSHVLQISHKHLTSPHHFVPYTDFKLTG